MIQFATERARCAIAYWRVHRYTFLFYALLLTLSGSPLLAALHFNHPAVLQSFVAVNLCIALLGIRNRRLSHMLVGICSVAIAIRLGADSISAPQLVAASYVTLVFLAFVATIDAVRVAMDSGEINAEHIYAALSAYMLAGVFFGVLHWAVELEWPGAYTVPEGGGLSLHDGIYFSFITQATLGYGDVLPRSEIARGIALLQAVAGQLYLAVMVARLVSLYVTQSDRSGSKKQP